MKILISWEALGNDYEKDKKTLRPDGPNLNFHQHFFEGGEYDKHALLTAGSTKNDLDRINSLKDYILSIVDDHKIETHQIPVTDPINTNEIQTKIRAFLSQMDSNDELHFFVSPGTPAMQVAWHLLHLEAIHPNTKLVQSRPAKFSVSGKPELLFIELEKSTVPNTLIQKELVNTKLAKVDSDILITPSLQKVYDDAKKVAAADRIHVLIKGNTGSGKENLAKYIHDTSAREGKPFEVLNCSAFNENLLLSELFGHEKGAFTGASDRKIGLFEESNGGTIFLDEIGDISSFMQQSLLRVLQNGEVRPVGSNETKMVDIRVICATHKNLKDMCTSGDFRWDLYYRISSVNLRIPSLVERGVKEITEYLDFIISQVKTQLRKPKTLKLSKRVRDRLLTYTYPGNLREMHNIISTLYVFYEDQEVDDFEHLSMLEEVDPITSLKYEQVERPFKKRHIERVLKMTNGNISKTAREIGWSENKLREHAKKVGLDVEDFRHHPE